jgi:hypothetical protein
MTTIPIQPRALTEQGFASTPPQTTRLHLPAHQLHRIRLRRALTVRVEAGVAWITIENDPNDHILSAGQSMTTAERGLMVIQPMTGVTLNLSARDELG